MKAFVIKVKENCYWLGGFYGKNNYDDIAHAKVYHLPSQAEKQCKLFNEAYGYNAKVVPITITEVDLEKVIRHQVCDEIRDKGLTDQIDGVKGVFISYQTLNKIEQGE